MLQEIAKPTAIPINGYDALCTPTEEDRRADKAQYQYLIGSILYAMIQTRPDIAFATGKLSQYMSDPAVFHHKAVKHLLRYIRSTAALRLRYGPGQDKITGYSDADYAADKSDRKSTLGYVFTFAGGAISWRSTKQRSVATSTTEAEYVALSTCAKQALWLRLLLADIGYSKFIGSDTSSMQIFGDNQSSLMLIENPQVHERSKHIDVCYHHVRDAVQKKLLYVQYTPSKSMLADGLTKPLPKPAFQEFVRGLGLTFKPTEDR